MASDHTQRTYLAVIPFVADNDTDAKLAVFTMSEGLGILRPEVDYYRAQVQGPADDKPHDVFCGAPGPEVGQACIDIAGHADHTLHHDGTGFRWTDHDIPTPPDTAEGLDP